jgi:hypothetical protein
VLAITAGSEVSTTDPRRREEQRRVMHTVLNRLPLSGFPGGFPGHPGSPFSIVVGDDEKTTGPQGARPYSTSRIPVGPTLAYFLEIAHEVMEQRIMGDTADGVVSFKHLPKAQAARIRARWERIGYTLVWEREEFKAGFFAPRPGKLAQLQKAAEGARRAKTGG